MKNILYCFISHHPFINEDSIRISQMMTQLRYDKYIITYGGEKSNIENKHAIHLNCPDDYCSLPEKINKTFKYAINNIDFDYLVKFDRTIQIHKIFDTVMLDDYCGLIYGYSNGKWHFNRCTQHHKWYNKEFIYPKINYALGLGYVLLRNCASYVSHNNDYNNHIYEDVYVGSVMISNNIAVKPFRFNFYDYFSDHTHPNL